MIALFNTYEEAQEFSDKVHQFLLENRNGYNAEKWANPNKSDKQEKWFIKIPEDFEKWKVKLDVSKEEKVTKLPTDWKNVEQIKKQL